MSSFYKVKGHFNPRLFNLELFNPMVQKFMVEKSGVEKFMVEKSGVERSGVKLGVEMSCNPSENATKVSKNWLKDISTPDF